MLPDLAKLKNEIYSFQKEFMHQSIQYSVGPFTDCNRIPMFEGHRHGVQRPSGDEEIRDFTPIEGGIVFKPHEDDLDITFSKLHETSILMGESFQRKAFEQLDKSLTEAGQSVDARGMSAFDSIFKMFEKIEFPLGQDGKLDMSGYKFIAGPDAYESMIKANKEIQLDPEKINKLQDLLRRKEESARVREANRKLVG